MPGTYAGFVNSAVGAKLAVQLGLPRPVRLRRYAADAPLIEGPVLVGGLPESPVAGHAKLLLEREGIDVVDSVPEGTKIGAVVLDLTGVESLRDLDLVRVAVADAAPRLRVQDRGVHAPAPLVARARVGGQRGGDREAALRQVPT